jgi:hypothetical protein
MIKNSGFRIQGENKIEVDAWKSLQFGIETNKQAVCKIDTSHNSTFDQMQYTMFSSLDYNTGKTNGMFHSIVLSPHSFNNNESSGTTPELKEGENEYFIRCKNFAGQVNDAPFVVQVTRGGGPDLLGRILQDFPQQIILF